MFVTFEGGEGSGKSTQIQLLSKELEKRNISHVVTREPGGTPLGEQLRHLLLAPTTTTQARLLMVWAARVQHIETVILPALNNNQWVLCDRFYHSTTVYQHDGEGVPMTILQSLEKNFLRVRPDCTFFFNITAEESVARIKKRLHNNHFDQKNLDFHKKIEKGFVNLFKNDSSVITIDAHDSINNIHSSIVSYLNPMLSDSQNLTLNERY